MSSTKNNEHLDHLFYSIKAIIKIIVQDKKDVKDLLKLIKPQLTKLISEKGKHPDLELMFNILDIIPDEENSKIVKTIERIIEQLMLKKDKLEDRELLNDYTEDFIVLSFKYYNKTNIAYKKRFEGYVNTLFRLLGNVKADIEIELEKEEEDKDNDKKSKKKVKNRELD